MTIFKKTTEQSSAENNESLPLTARKSVPLKIYGIIALLIVIVLANVFLFHHDESPQKPDEAIDNYSLNPVNPIAQNQSSTANKSDNLIQSKQDKFRKELEEAKAKDFIERLQAGQAVEGGVNQAVNVSSNHDVTTAHYATPNSSGAAYSPSDPNTAYLNNVSQAHPERSFAERLAPQPYLIGQGKFIFATLAVAINSDLPGQVSAIVNQDIYGEQGRNVLIPRGSRLVGEYRSMLGNNQNRIFIVWTRVIQPNGISVMIGSEGTDALGQAGMTGDVNYHFLARFGTATLISLIGAGASTVGVNPDDEYNSMAAYRQAVSQAMAQQASSTLGQNANIPPTVHVKQGERVVVFVNKDLDFSKVSR